MLRPPEHNLAPSAACATMESQAATGVVILYFQFAWRVVAALLCTAVLLFGGAGDFHHPDFWTYLALMAGGGVLLPCIIERGLLNERLHPRAGQDANLPRRLALLFGIHALIAGLDARFGWSHAPLAARICGMGGATAGFAWLMWAMRTNRFFSPVVRLQPERGHGVVSWGPYRHVRHPGYLGALLMGVCSGVGLGSWWSVLPGLVAAGLILRRTQMEDVFLRARFTGYREYTRHARWRLIPGIW